MHFKLDRLPLIRVYYEILHGHIDSSENILTWKTKIFTNFEIVHTFVKGDCHSEFSHLCSKSACTQGGLSRRCCCELNHAVSRNLERDFTCSRVESRKKHVTPYPLLENTEKFVIALVFNTPYFFCLC